MKKKNVLYVITKSNFGGAQRYLFDIATNLPEEQFSVTVALGGTGERDAKTGTLKEKLEEKNISVISVEHFMRDMSLLQDMRAFIELLRIIHRVKPDVLHVTSSKAGGLGAFAGRLLFVPRIIFTSHGLAYDEAWRHPLQRALIFLASWLTFFLSTKTIQITNDTFTRASRLPCMSKKMVLVHNGRFEPELLPRKEARQKLCQGETVCSEQWIGTIAELTKNKNLDVFFEAVAIVHKAGIRPHIWILGEGEERDNLEKLAKSLSLEHFVHMPGYIHNASNYLSAFDIFTLPSRKEGLPYVLLEAGYASLPAVVSTVPGVKDIIIHEQTGLMVTATPENLAQAYTRLLQDENLKKEYGKALNKHVRDVFSMEKMIADTSQVYLG
jgi:glycosyltransferase involved in cell wall biosynthesis